MTDLTPEQRGFFRDQKIPLSLVFNGSGMSKAMRESLMDSLDLKFYYGGAPCQKSGHTLRSKAGHCIQCDTSKIAYQMRSSQSGYVYLAYSQKGSCAKIGSTGNGPKERVEYLASLGYAGYSDWQLMTSRHIPAKAGMVEFHIHELLAEFQRPVSYKKQGVTVNSREVFFCSLEKARAVFDATMPRQ
jgi:hypothetical protein